MCLFPPQKPAFPFSFLLHYCCGTLLENAAQSYLATEPDWFWNLFVMSSKKQNETKDNHVMGGNCQQLSI